MDLLNVLTDAKRQIGITEGAVRYVTDKGRIRKSEPEKWEKAIYKVEVKKGKYHVTDFTEKEKPKQAKRKPKKQVVSELRDSADEAASEGI